jgi:hypothetical protein
MRPGSSAGNHHPGTPGQQGMNIEMVTEYRNGDRFIFITFL